MPKGDRQKLKADLEDGHTPIANLLLEALAIAPLSGVEKGAVLALWRVTYGWKDREKRRTEAVASLQDWARFLNTHPVYAGRVVSHLVEKKVIKRVDLGKGKGYCYSMNTRVNEWVGGKLNDLGLTKRFSLPPTKRLRVPSTDKFTPSATNLASPKENNKENVNKGSSYIDNGNKIFTTCKDEIGDVTPGIANQIEEALQNYPASWIEDAIKEAVLHNKRHWGYVRGILENWTRDGEPASARQVARRDRPAPPHLLEGLDKDDPNKYIKGKYGHMVHR